MTGVHDSDWPRAEAALREAMAIVRGHADRGVDVEWKDGGSPVTAADRDVDAALRERLPQDGDGWLSEESGDDPRRLQCSRVWVVDPLDGTRAFAAGRTDYSVSIALVVDGQPVLGAVGNPVNDMVVVGGPERGLSIAGKPELTWPVDDPRPRILASRSEMRRGEWVVFGDQAQVQPVGSVAYKLALVAAGFADATWTLHPKHEWDVAAGAALLAAVGGEVWLPRGGHLRWNRNRPRFLSFAGAQPGRRERAEALLRLRQ